MDAERSERGALTERVLAALDVLSDGQPHILRRDSTGPYGRVNAGMGHRLVEAGLARYHVTCGHCGHQDGRIVITVAGRQARGGSDGR